MIVFHLQEATLQRTFSPFPICLTHTLHLALKAVCARAATATTTAVPLTLIRQIRNLFHDDSEAT